MKAQDFKYQLYYMFLLAGSDHLAGDDECAFAFLATHDSPSWFYICSRNRVLRKTVSEARCQSLPFLVDFIAWNSLAVLANKFGTTVLLVAYLDDIYCSSEAFLLKPYRCTLRAKGKSLVGLEFTSVAKNYLRNPLFCRRDTHQVSRCLDCG